MPRPLNATSKVMFRAYLPIDLKAKLDLALFSPLEGKVPHGDYSAFFESRLREHFEWSSLDLEPYGGLAGEFVRGPSDMIERLRMKLETQ